MMIKHQSVAQLWGTLFSDPFCRRKKEKDCRKLAGFLDVCEENSAATP